MPLPRPNGFIPPSLEEEEVLSVQVNGSGSDARIAVQRILSTHQVSSNGYFSNGGETMGLNSRDSSPSASFRRPRPLPPLNPLINNLASSQQTISVEPERSRASSNLYSSGSDTSPFLRRLDSFRRSSTEFSISGFKLTTATSNIPNNAATTAATTTATTTAGNNDFDNELAADGLDVRQSSSSESQALYGNEDVVKDLKPEYARWFYKYDADRAWIPFTGYDSIRLEQRYRALLLEREVSYAEVATADDPSECNGYYYHHNNEYYQHLAQYYNGKIGNGNVRASVSGAIDFVNYLDEHKQTFYDKHQHKHAASASTSTHGGVGGTHLYAKSSTYPRFEDGRFDCTQGKENGGESPPDKNGGDQNVIIVRGGLYEADLETWNCTATYWPGDKCQIIRGTWFYDLTWQPLNVEHADKLEEEHLGQFAGVSLSAVAQTNASTLPDSPTKKNRPVMHRVSFMEFHVDWTSPTEIHLFSKAASYKFMRSVGQRLGFQTWGHRLCRGYFKPASMDDRPPEISHLVFVVHGIGQKMDTGRIVRNCASFRETVSGLKEKFFPHLNETKQRAEFFPVEWRSAAKLDGDVVEAITPHKLLSLRQLLNATAMDIMYYTSPLYKTEIQNALRNELNRIYSDFVKRNPDFRSRGGKVSVIAHSLGAVIAYDIITGYMPQSPDMPQYSAQVLDDQILGESARTDNTPPGLLFQLEHFFCLGSPLSVFLALRWREPHNPSYRSYILPRLLCKRIYNVFYSTDPVAYRVEPLLNKHYVHIAPLPVYSYGSLGRPKYDEMPRERINKEINFIRQIQSQEPTAINVYPPTQDPSKSTPQKIPTDKSPPTPTKESNWGWATLMKYLKSGDPTADEISTDGELTNTELVSPDGGNSSPSGNSSPDEIAANEIPNDLEYRMDFVLKESNFSSTYLAALTSHTSYWSSPDTAFFVLQHLYGDTLDNNSPSQNSSVAQ